MDLIDTKGLIRFMTSRYGAICRTTTISEGIRAFEGPARVFHSEEEVRSAVFFGNIKKVDVVVIRYEGPRGTAVGHISPEAAVGDVIAVAAKGGIIKIDIPGRRTDLLLPDKTIKKRLSKWKLPLKKSKGILGIYAKTALQAHLGTMIDNTVESEDHVTWANALSPFSFGKNSKSLSSSK